MKKWMLAICLMFKNGICEAADCFDLAGRDYKIDPDLLRAISWKESRYRVHLVSPAMAAAAAVTGHFADIRNIK